MSKFKPYKDIMEQKFVSDSKLLTDGKKELSLATVNENTGLIAAELEKGLTKQVLDKISDIIPYAASNLILANEAIPEQKREALARITDELTTDLYTVQRRRSDIEKRMSVLQDNRFTTAAAKFHQAKLESTVQWGNCVNNSLNIEKQKIKLEKLKYKYDKNKAKILEGRQKGEDTFLLEKKVQLLAIEITEQLIILKSSQIEADSLASELLEWSELKDQLYKEAEESNEQWNPEDVNEGQDIFLSQRFFQNFLVAHQSGNDGQTSDIINIDGLASGAIKSGIKNGFLGKVFENFNDDQIKFIWLNLCGYNIDVIRQNNLPVAILNKSNNQLTIISKNVQYSEETLKIDTV